MTPTPLSPDGPPRSHTVDLASPPTGIGGRNVREQAACDDCDWEGTSGRSARAHHDKTGHNCHHERNVQTFYGDPLTSWLREQGMTKVAGTNPS